MKKLFSLCLASVLFFGSATLFLGCGESGPTDDPTMEEIQTEDPGEMDTVDPVEPGAPE